MKLELKHLAPYLPYGLKAVIRLREDSSLPIDDECVVTVSCFEVAYLDSEYEEFKPILRPLSDLSSLSDDKIQINEHAINTLLGYGDIEFSHYKGDLDFIHEGDPDQGYDSSKTINFNTFELVRTELLKGHYDVFGLIKKGLAIDINTLKK